MKTFKELGIIDPLVKAIQEIGFETAMPVQEEVIPYLLGDNIDLVALAQTGTGKTAAFGLPILQKLLTDDSNRKKNNPTALILSPTRELCVQIADDLANYAKYASKISVVAVYGGADINGQIRAIERGVDIIVATPGRLLDLLRRNKLALSEVRTVVLDEADEMLNMGFSDSIDEILKEIPEHRHLLLFSATMPKEIARIAKSYLKNPKEIIIGDKNSINENIKHIYYVISAKSKYLALKRIADFYPNVYAIVFCRTRAETKEVAELLIKDGYNADALHGDLSQAQRDYVMQRFRFKTINMLVATDVAARGLDVNDLTHVIHYGLPDDVESYTHRSGRTARAGKTGLSIAICHSREKSRIRMIEERIGGRFERAFLPGGRAICEKQIDGLAERIEREQPDTNTDIDDILPAVLNKLATIERDDLIRRIVSLEFRRLFEYYKVAPQIEEADEHWHLPLSEREKSQRERGARSDRGKSSKSTEEGMVRLNINFGKADKIYPNKLIELINRCCPGPRVKIGKIDLYANEAFFDVDEYEADSVISEMNRYEVNGRPIQVGFSKDEDSKRSFHRPGRTRRAESQGRRRPTQPTSRRGTSSRGTRGKDYPPLKDKKKARKQKEDTGSSSNERFYDFYNKKR